MHEPSSGGAAEMSSPHATSLTALAPHANRVVRQMARRIIVRTKDGRATGWGDLIADGFTSQQIGAHFPDAKALVDRVVFRQDDLETLQRQTAEALLRRPLKTDEQLIAIAVDKATGLLPSEQDVFGALRAVNIEARDIGRLWPQIAARLAAHMGSGKLPQVA